MYNVRILIATDKFAQSMKASQAGAAIARGWTSVQPDAEFDLCPISDGGTGFVDVLHQSIDGEVRKVRVTGPMGDSVDAELVLVGEGASRTAYVESAEACGLHLVEPDRRDPERATSRGVGEVILAALDAGATRVVVGVGGTAVNDGGAGLLDALGATSDVELSVGAAGLDGITRLDLSPVRERLADVQVEVATDVDVPLLGLRGATNGFAAQKGASQESIMRLEGLLERFAEVVGRRPDGKSPAVALGAGAGGGIGFALLALGAVRTAGFETVRRVTDFDARVARADLVITGEGRFDWQSLEGKAVEHVAGASMHRGVPCLVLAGQVLVSRREYSSIGVSAAYAVCDDPLDLRAVEVAIASGADGLAALAAKVARTWR